MKITSPRHLLRRARLELLIKEVGGVTQLALLSDTPKSHISAMLSGSRGMGDALAAKLEKIGEKPAGWMDAALDYSAGEEAAHIREGSNVRPLAVSEMRLVPLISWVQAGHWCDATPSFAPSDALDWLPCPSKHGPNTYALEVVGISMDGPGGYREGEIIFVDPDVEATTGRDVIACTPDGQATFKRFKDDMDGRYLLALNPSFPERIIRMPPGTRFCGVVIGSYVRRGP